MSGRKARLRMAMDALEPLRDDLPVPGLALEDLDAASATSFTKGEGASPLFLWERASSFDVSLLYNEDKVKSLKEV
jgi:hypothetical protein